MCDLKPAAITFLKEQESRATGNAMQSSTTCLFRTIDEVCDGKALCAFHDRACCLREGQPDLVTLGAPCQPYSSMRSSRRVVPPHRHKDWPVIFQKFMLYIDTHHPRAGIVEQVLGFAAPVARGEDEQGEELPSSWLAQLLSDLERRGYASRVFKLDNDVWSDMPRPRLSCGVSAHQLLLAFRGVSAPYVLQISGADRACPFMAPDASAKAWDRS